MLTKVLLVCVVGICVAIVSSVSVLKAQSAIIKVAMSFMTANRISFPKRFYPPAYLKDKDILKQSIQKCKKGAEPPAGVTIYRVPFEK